MPFYRQVPRILAIFAAILGLHGCGGGSSSDSGGGTTVTNPAITLTAGTLLGSQSVAVARAAGSTIAYHGAAVEIPPNGLSKDATLSLYEFSIPAATGGAGSGTLGGQTLLSDKSYVLGVDQDVTLSAPLKITLPVDKTKIPAGTPLGKLHLSVINGGVLIPQGNPTSYDATGGTVTMQLTLPNLKKEYTQPLSAPPPLPLGIPFLAIVDKILLVATGGAVVSVVWNPMVATIDDVTTTVTMNTYDSTNFNITYRGNVTDTDVTNVWVALERARDLYIGKMGFSLPNFFNLDGQYTVYLDSFDNHYYIGDGNADGLTFPGSGLFEGASYVNTKKPNSGWPSTAVHEYFHAVQYGEIYSFVPNLWYRSVFPEASWLFEGSATALAGRVIFGGQQPHRDETLGEHINQGMSVYDPAQKPGGDVAQDFFYFLEKSFGNTTFYRPMFDALSSASDDDIAVSVAAVDGVIRKSDSSGKDNLSLTWMEFINDFVFLNPSQYGGQPNPAEQKAVATNGQNASIQKEMPPLSYYLMNFAVPQLDPATPDPLQPQDIEIQLQLQRSDVVSMDFFIELTKNNAPVAGYPKRVTAFSALPYKETLKGFRTDKTNTIRIVAVNDKLKRSAVYPIIANVRLQTLTTLGQHIAYYATEVNSFVPTIRGMNLATAENWNIGAGTLLGISSSGVVLRFEETSSTKKVLATPDWGRGTPDAVLTPGCRASIYVSESGVAITNEGRVYYPGSYDYIYSHVVNGKTVQEKRVNDGIVSCLYTGDAYVDVRFDINESGEIDSVDSFLPSDLVVAKNGRPLVFATSRANKTWLATVDTSGAGFRWLTDNYSEDLSISDDGSQIAFQLDQTHDFRLGTMPTAGGKVIDLDLSTGLELAANGAGISPNGSTIAASYLLATNPSAPEVGIAFINSNDGTIQRKINLLSKVFPDLRPPQFTSDGRYVVFGGQAVKDSKPDGLPDIFMMNVDGSELRNLTQTPNRSESAPMIR